MLSTSSYAVFGSHAPSTHCTYTRPCNGLSIRQALSRQRQSSGGVPAALLTTGSVFRIPADKRANRSKASKPREAHSSRLRIDRIRLPEPWSCLGDRKANTAEKVLQGAQRGNRNAFRDVKDYRRGKPAHASTWRECVIFSTRSTSAKRSLLEKVNRRGVGRRARSLQHDRQGEQTLVPP